MAFPTDILDLPFNRFLGIVRSDRPELGALMLPGRASYHNHVGTVHAAALYALAETSSGDALVRAFADVRERYVPLLRRGEIKYSRPARGTMYGSARIGDAERAALRTDLDRRGRGTMAYDATVCDAGGQRVVTVRFEWFVQAA